MSSMNGSATVKKVDDVPRGNFAGFVRYLKHDLVSGFLVFLIALPLCLGISLNCGYPPIAGIFTAIIGAILATCISDSELTIKGPAAGLIVIVLGCVKDFGGDGKFDAVSPADVQAYKMALAVGVAAALLQIAFGVFRAGRIAEFFPLTPVHGMLAAIGVIIILKQIPFALGVDGKGEPLELARKIPEFIFQANPAIAAIGLVSILIMFLWPVLSKKFRWLGVIPSPMVVLIAAIPMGMAFDLLHEHSYYLQGHEYQLSEQYLVQMPERPFGMLDAVTFPDFSALSRPVAYKWVFMFFMIGTLESVLSAKAIDLIDPWKRKSSMDRDTLAIGVGNLFCSLVGGLPMISEIVRSRANIDNGARTRFADMWHGVFLLVCVALIPMYLHRIPLAALAAMLVYTGYRLAHPKEFINVYKIGREQFVIFVATLIGVLATDLLIGIGIGIALKMVIHVMNGAPLRSMFQACIDVEPRDDNTCLIRVHHSAVFSNWIPFKRRIEDVGLAQRQNVVIDLAETKLVDHSVMEKLHQLQRDFEKEGLTLDVVGLEAHRPVADHELSARLAKPALVKRLTVYVDEALEEKLERQFIELGATGLTTSPCMGAGRHDIYDGVPQKRPRTRIEVIASMDVSDKILAYLRQEILPEHRVTACAQTVEVIRLDQFAPDALESRELQVAH